MDSRLAPQSKPQVQWVNAPQTLGNSQPDRLRNLGQANSAYQLHELKFNVRVDTEALEKNGLDEVLIRAENGKQYIAYHKELPDLHHVQAGDQVQLATAQGQEVIGEVSFVDNELTSYDELGRRVKENPIGFLSIAGVPIVVTQVFSGLARSGGGGDLMLGPSLMQRMATPTSFPKTLPTMALGFAIAAGALAAMTYSSVNRKSDDQAIQALLK